MMPDQKEHKTPTMKFLEERNEHLEKELAEKDGNTARLLRAMEQQCNQAKVSTVNHLTRAFTHYWVWWISSNPDNSWVHGEFIV